MIRNIARHKFHSGITISGLTVGLTFALFVGAFIVGELKVNKDLKDVDRLYLLEAHPRGVEGNMPPFFVPARLGPAAVEKYAPAFVGCYRFYDRAITLSKGDRNFRMQSMLGDSTLLNMFGFRILHGEAENTLSAPNSIVITEKTAYKFFDRADVDGESLTVSTESGGRKELLITAVIADLQEKNSVTDFMNMDAQVFLSLEAAGDFSVPAADSWTSSIITYVKLAPEVTGSEAEGILNGLLLADAPSSVSENKTIKLAPLSDYYLLTNHGAVRKLILSLTAIAIFILVLAITNFINISIARSFYRLKEVGVRKSVGGLKRQIAVQFLCESLLFAIFSGGLALIFYEALRPYLEKSLDASLGSLAELGVAFWVVSAGGLLLIGALAGIYPSLYLSSSRTIESLKGKFGSVKGPIQFSRALIAIQFLIASFVLTVSLIFSKQIAYFMEADLGYDRSRILIVSSVPRIWNDEGMSKMDAARREFLGSPKIRSASLSWGAPNFNFSPASSRITRADHPFEQGILTTITAADEAYDEVYSLKMAEGEFFYGKGDGYRPSQLVVNEIAQKALHLAIGDRVKIEGRQEEFTVAGIVKDFKFQSMHEPIKPLAFLHPRDFRAFRYLSFKLEDGSLIESIQEVEKLWERIFSNEPFEYAFADERLTTIYKAELQLEKASAIGSALILVIVLTGVLGLVSLTLKKREKEMGIRKVLGATTPNILILISREYVILMLLSFIIGIPISYLFGLQWLSNFAYQTELTWWVIAAPTAFLFFLTVAVVVAQSLKTAISNPINALRYE